MKTTLATLSLILLIAVGAWTTRESEFGLSLQHAIGSRLKPYGMVTTLAIEGVGDVPLFVNPADKIITPWIWSGRVWEPTETKWFVNSLRPGDVVVDVGANVGYYTVLAGLLVGDTGRVYAFEPDPVAFEILRKNVALSGLDNVASNRRRFRTSPAQFVSTSMKRITATIVSISRKEKAENPSRSKRSTSTTTSRVSRNRLIS